uniref:7TM_GPCR_Srx domain-containing protein n=1 Tax=Parastrongyloides trichosuri TaxID=131310 RepID=A0A0N4ZK17_PARTI
MHRLSLISSFVERLVATKFCKIYEKNVNRLFPILLCILCILWSIIWILLTNIGVIGILLNSWLHISSLSLSLLGTLILLHLNKQLEKEYKRNLTERFIIKDNIRIAKFVLPKLLITNLGEIIIMTLFRFRFIYKYIKTLRLDIIFYNFLVCGPIMWNVMIFISYIFDNYVFKRKINENTLNIKNNEGYIYFDKLNKQWEVK